MKRKTNSIRKNLRYNSLKGSYIWVLLLFSFCAHSQEIVEKRITSDLDKIVIEFDLIDHIQLLNNNDSSDIIVRAEGSTQISSFQLKESGEQVLIKGKQLFVDNEEFDEDKVCSVEPNYTSFQIYIPKNKILFVSFIEGNFYADGYKGEINLRVEDGIIKLRSITENTNIRLNSGSIFVHKIENTEIDAETNLGILISDLSDKTTSGSPIRKLELSDSETNKSLKIRAIMANIYLYGSKG